MYKQNQKQATVRQDKPILAPIYLAPFHKPACDIVLFTFACYDQSYGFRMGRNLRLRSATFSTSLSRLQFGHITFLAPYVSFNCKMHAASRNYKEWSNRENGSCLRSSHNIRTSSLQEKTERLALIGKKI